MTDLPATKIAELIERARAAIARCEPGTILWAADGFASPYVVLALAEEILRRRAEEKSKEA
jgi:hypothetical protein